MKGDLVVPWSPMPRDGFTDALIRFSLGLNKLFSIENAYRATDGRGRAEKKIMVDAGPGQGHLSASVKHDDNDRITTKSMTCSGLSVVVESEAIGKSACRRRVFHTSAPSKFQRGV